MKRNTRKTVPEAVRSLRRARLLQSAAAGVYIFVVFCVLHALHNELAIASLGASTFIAFGFPKAQSSRTRNLLGGYAVGVASGLLCTGVLRLLPEGGPVPGYIIASTLTVILSIFFMTLWDCPHPPSTALAVSIILSETPLILGLAGMGSIAALCGLLRLLRSRLQNLQREGSDR